MQKLYNYTCSCLYLSERRELLNLITVIGSIAMDLVITTDQIPSAGETLFGESFSIVPGGKGANQGVAIARLAPNQTNLIGCVGQDSFARDALENFQKNQLNFEFVKEVPGSTGVASIILYEKDNRILVIPGANNQVNSADWKGEWELLKKSDMVVLQNEIPHKTNLEIAKFCHLNQVKVLYNPAPTRPTDQEMIPYVDFFTPNEHECEVLFPGLPLEDVLARYPNKLVVTLGSKGVTFHDGDQVVSVPAVKVDPIDTTGAGDTFNGAFAFAISRGLNITQSCRFAVIVASLSVLKFGAQGGMPTLSQVKEHRAYEKAWNLE